jgi:RNA polymerase sigma-70 factor (ECF subfamily)
MDDLTASQLQQRLDRFNGGDPLARDELLALAQGRLRRLAAVMWRDFARLHAFAELDDLLQNAALRIMRRLESHTIPDVPGFLALAGREMRRELLDMCRHYFGPEGDGARLAALPLDATCSAGEIKPGEPSTYDPQRLALWKEFHAQVETLPVEERMVFDLLYYHELSQTEAAAVLGVSLATVKRRWLAARLRLQDALPLDGPST